MICLGCFDASSSRSIDITEPVLPASRLLGQAVLDNTTTKGHHFVAIKTMTKPCVDSDSGNSSSPEILFQSPNITNRKRDHDSTSTERARLFHKKSRVESNTRALAFETEETKPGVHESSLPDDMKRRKNSNVETNQNQSASRPLDCEIPDTALVPGPIRFPRIDQDSTAHLNKDNVPLPIEVTVMVRCMWQHCTSTIAPSQSLLEHIQTAHVAFQASSSAGADTRVDESYSCQWEGCKVKGKKSASRTWLEKHVLSHGGPKPFRCFVDSCEQRFNSQVTNHNKFSKY